MQEMARAAEIKAKSDELFGRRGWTKDEPPPEEETKGKRKSRSKSKGKGRDGKAGYGTQRCSCSA